MPGSGLAVGEAGNPPRRAGLRWGVERRGKPPPRRDGRSRDGGRPDEGPEKGGRRSGTERRGGKEGIQIAYFVGFF